MSNGVHSGGGGTCPGERSFFEERLFHMVYEKEEILQYVIEEDVKFIRMTFCDVMGRLKNVSIMPDELDRAFAYGISIDASAIAGFGGEVHSDLVLRPDASTLCILPWRPEHGRVVRMFCSVYYPDGRPICGLPGCVMYAKRTIFDLVLPYLVTDTPVTAKWLSGLGNGGLCLNCPVCHFPNCGFGKGV